MKNRTLFSTMILLVITVIFTLSCKNESTSSFTKKLKPFVKKGSLAQSSLLNTLPTTTYGFLLWDSTLPSAKGYAQHASTFNNENSLVSLLKKKNTSIGKNSTVLMLSLIHI